MATFTVQNYSLTLAKVRDRVRTLIREDDSVDDLIDERVNDALQRICWEIQPKSLIAVPEYLVTSGSTNAYDLPQRVMRVVSMVVVPEDRRPIYQVTPQEMLQRHQETSTLPSRWPYFFAEMGRNIAASVTSYFTDTIKAKTVHFDSQPEASTTGIEVQYQYEHPLLSEDNQVIMLDPPYHSLVVDGALLELAELTGESVADFEKRQRRFELRLQRAKDRMNDEYAMPVIKGEFNTVREIDRIGEIPRPVGHPRFP